MKHYEVKYFFNGIAGIHTWKARATTTKEVREMFSVEVPRGVVISIMEEDRAFDAAAKDAEIAWERAIEGR